PGPGPSWMPDWEWPAAGWSSSPGSSSGRASAPTTSHRRCARRRSAASSRCGTGCGLRRPDVPWRRLAQQVAVVTGPLLVVVILRVPYLGLAVRLWLVALGAIGLGLLTERALAGRVVRDVPSFRLAWSWWRRPRRERVRALEEL